MAKKGRRKPVNPNKDTRQRSTPKTEGEKKAAAKSELYTELQAELVRLDMQGFLFRRWMRQAMGIGSAQVGFKFFLDDFEDGFKNSQSQNKQFNPKEMVVGWDEDSRPKVVKLSQDVTVFRNPPKAPGEGGKTENYSTQKQSENDTRNKKSPLKR
ncbi:MAG: hypothetical protein VKK42_19555 [Lyngbya sp.]|nr:hypothetical protein [Lyngbya sp.]